MPAHVKGGRTLQASSWDCCIPQVPFQLSKFTEQSLRSEALPARACMMSWPAQELQAAQHQSHAQRESVMLGRWGLHWPRPGQHKAALQVQKTGSYSQQVDTRNMT